LTPASRRQDLTTSPFASASFVSAPFDRSQISFDLPCITFRAQRWLAASTASPPAFVTIAKRPSVAETAADMQLI
jgi:hypothetical protein